MLGSKTDKIFLFLFLFFLLLYCSLVFFTNDGYGGADSFQHYLIAHFSWKHPELLLHHWGKPFFTLFISPFAQLGYKGALLFNVAATFFSTFVVYKIASILRRDNVLPAPLFYLLMPMPALVAVSSLTEAWFAFLLVLSVWLFAREKYFFSLLLLSFLPLARSEGFVVFPAFVFVLLLKKKWKWIPLLVTGTLVYSVVGYFILGDFFWLINQSPYTLGANQIYGSGPWYHFLLQSRVIFGTAITALIVAGLWFYIPKNIGWFKTEKNQLRILIAGSFVAYFISHSYVWWKGMGSSLGLERVIAGVCPLAAIIAFEGYDFFAEKIRKYVSPAWLLIPLLITAAINFKMIVPGNLKQDTEQKVMTQAAKWIKANTSLQNQKLYYYNPHIVFLLNKDFFDKNEVEPLWSLIDENEPLLWLQDGQYLVWDAHFGSNEGRTPLEKIIHKKDVKILRRFYPEEQTWVLGGYRYQVFIFGKQSGWKDSIVELIPDTHSVLHSVNNKFFSVASGQEFADIYQGDLQQFINSDVVYLDVELNFPAEQKPGKDNVLFVVDMNCNGHSLIYAPSDISAGENRDGKIVSQNRIMLPPLTKDCAQIKLYLWNRNHAEINEIKARIKFFYLQPEKFKY